MFTCLDAVTWSGAFKKMLRVSSLYMMITAEACHFWREGECNPWQRRVRGARVAGVRTAATPRRVSGVLSASQWQALLKCRHSSRS
ncbi:hypothetical protein EYF80_056520 [Liparis tanakae]|uniref:Uncharacterized protein n=1 Tax=Liparis tanakae TaxID=230148 RepID=A0A4Z2EWR3_9TELE|nr:hypothetical protein EYF80_056520 [Liparis tanakae]